MSCQGMLLAHTNANTFNGKVELQRSETAVCKTGGIGVSLLIRVLGVSRGV